MFCWACVRAAGWSSFTWVEESSCVCSACWHGSGVKWCAPGPTGQTGPSCPAMPTWMSSRRILDRPNHPASAARPGLLFTRTVTAAWRPVSTFRGVAVEEGKGSGCIYIRQKRTTACRKATGRSWRPSLSRGTTHQTHAKPVCLCSG